MSRRFRPYVRVSRADTRVAGSITWEGAPGRVHSNSTRFDFPVATPIDTVVQDVTGHLGDLSEPLRFQIRDQLRAELERVLT